MNVRLYSHSLSCLGSIVTAAGFDYARFQLDGIDVDW